MPIGTSGAYDLEIQRPNGLWLGLMLARQRNQADEVVEGAPVRTAEALTASNSDLPVGKRLETKIWDDWSRGIGLDYAWAPGVCTRIPKHALPAGAITSMNGGLGGVTMPARASAFAEYGNDWWVGVDHGVYRVAGGTADPIVLSLTLPGTHYVRDMVPMDNGSGTLTLYVFASDASYANGLVYAWAGAGWSAAGVMGTPGRNRTTRVYWAGKDGIGAQRLVSISGPYTIAYTLPNTNPLLPGSWVEGVKIGSSSILTDLAGSRRHVYVAGDDVYDLNEIGESVGLRSYSLPTGSAGVGTACEYLDGYVYAALGSLSGLDRVRVDQGAVLNENPGQCAPGWGTEAENPVRGQVTALCVDQGYLVAAVWNVSTQTTYICWGKDRNTLGIESPNPLIWYGPEALISGHIVDRMRVSTLGGEVRLWIVARHYSSGAILVCWQSLPVAGSPVQDLMSSGPHRYATGAGGTWQPYCRLYSLPQPWQDKAAVKIIYQHDVSTRVVDANTGTKLTYYDRADATLGSTAWPAGIDVVNGPVQTIAPSTTLKGNLLEERIDFFAPQGSADPPLVPILDGVRSSAWSVVPAFGVWAVTVEYGAGVVNLLNVDDGNVNGREPDTITQQLIDITQMGPTYLRDRQGRIWIVKMEQAITRSEILHEGDTPKTVQADVELTKILGPI